jgi:hypothetical protein
MENKKDKELSLLKNKSLRDDKQIKDLIAENHSFKTKMGMMTN